MTEGVKTRAYIKWLTRTGKPQIVIPLTFVGLRRNEKGHVVTFYDPEGNAYNGEVWKCRTEDNKIKEFTFPVESEKDELVGWGYNKNPIDDEMCNTHFDSWEWNGQNYKRIHSEIVETEKELQVKNVLEGIIANTNDSIEGLLAQVKLMVLTTPSTKIVEEWKHLMKTYPDEITELNNKL